MIAFTIAMEPIGKGRPRATVRQGRVWCYTPTKTVTAERLIAREAKASMGAAKPLVGALKLAVVATFAIPKSWPKSARVDPKHTSRPDLDNVLKIVADALNGICYHDDCQLVAASIRKQYGAQPSIHVELEPA